MSIRLSFMDGFDSWLGMDGVFMSVNYDILEIEENRTPPWLFENYHSCKGYGEDLDRSQNQYYDVMAKEGLVAGGGNQSFTFGGCQTTLFLQPKWINAGLNSYSIEGWQPQLGDGSFAEWGNCYGHVHGMHYRAPVTRPFPEGRGGMLWSMELYGYYSTRSMPQAIACYQLPDVDEVAFMFADPYGPTFTASGGTNFGWHRQTWPYPRGFIDESEYEFYDGAEMWPTQVASVCAGDRIHLWYKRSPRIIGFTWEDDSDGDGMIDPVTDVTGGSTALSIQIPENALLPDHYLRITDVTLGTTNEVPVTAAMVAGTYQYGCNISGGDNYDRVIELGYVYKLWEDIGGGVMDWVYYAPLASVGSIRAAVGFGKVVAQNNLRYSTAHGTVRDTVMKNDMDNPIARMVPIQDDFGMDSIVDVEYINHRMYVVEGEEDVLEVNNVSYSPAYTSKIHVFEDDFTFVETHDLSTLLSGRAICGITWSDVWQGFALMMDDADVTPFGELNNIVVVDSTFTTIIKEFPIEGTGDGRLTQLACISTFGGRFTEYLITRASYLAGDPPRPYHETRFYSSNDGNYQLVNTSSSFKRKGEYGGDLVTNAGDYYLTNFYDQNFAERRPSICCDGIAVFTVGYSGAYGPSYVGDERGRMNSIYKSSPRYGPRRDDVIFGLGTDTAPCPTLANGATTRLEWIWNRVYEGEVGREAIMSIYFDGVEQTGSAVSFTMREPSNLSDLDRTNGSATYCRLISYYNGADNSHGEMDDYYFKLAGYDHGDPTRAELEAAMLNNWRIKTVSPIDTSGDFANSSKYPELGIGGPVRIQNDVDLVNHLDAKNVAEDYQICPIVGGVQRYTFPPVTGITGTIQAVAACAVWNMDNRDLLETEFYENPRTPLNFAVSSGDIIGTDYNAVMGPDPAWTTYACNFSQADQWGREFYIETPQSTIDPREVNPATGLAWTANDVLTLQMALRNNLVDLYYNYPY